MYLEEILPKHLRGSLGAMNQVLISCTCYFLVSTFCLLACYNSSDEFLRLTLVVSSSCRLLIILYITLAMIYRPDCNPFSCFNFSVGNMDQLFITIGITLSYTLGIFCSWRVLAILGTSQNNFLFLFN
jgi:hypothetical protein